MSLEAILASIESSGEAEIDELRHAAESRAQSILEAAERQAAIAREEARRAALWPVSAERARRLHQAKLEALHIVGAVRYQLSDMLLVEIRQRLADLRADPGYVQILRRLIVEALEALGEAELRRGGILQIDARDEAQVNLILHELGIQLPVVTSLQGWGGIVIASSDGRIVVDNTLEARLARATPFLQQGLLTFLAEGAEMVV